MSDTVFFDTILPSTGLRCLAVPRQNGGYRHKFGPDNAWLAAEIASLSTSANVDVYYGCSSFTPMAQDREVDPSTGKLVRGGRRQANVAFVRSFWADLDVGPPKPGKPPKYRTQRQAVIAIFAFADKLGLPRPWLVNSGWGVHAYWPMDRDMTVAEWKPLAEALKRALRAAGVLFDPSRTADEASVLRPPGTFNRKGDPRDVTLVFQGGVWTMPQWATAMTPYVQAGPAAGPASTLGAMPAYVAKLTANNAALGQPDPSSATMIADQCAVMGMMRDTGGQLDEPTWYNLIGVLNHTVEAPAIVHEWSKKHDEYSVAETNAKLAQQANHGPTTCIKIADHQSAVCDVCPHWNKIKSPIQLGRPQRADPGQAEAEAAGGGKGGAFGGGAAPGQPSPRNPGGMPYGYGFRLEGGHKVLTHLIPASDDKPEQWLVFCETFFVPKFNYEVDGVHFNDWVADTLDGDQREFTLSGGIIGTGGRDVAAKLGENGIMVMPGKARVMDGYLNRWMSQLTKTMPLVRAYKSFGWTGDVFVTAGLTLSADGEENTAVLAKPALDRKNAVTTKGDLATWVKLVDRAYNAPGQEAYQFQLAAGFASPLLVMMDQVRGVTVYAHSSGSGVGKSTVQKVALSAWGNWEDMMLAQGKVTGNALWGFLGAYNTLPVMFDELTNAPNAEVSDLVFSVSSGRAKERMNSAGELRTNNANWSLILLANGNSLLSDKLSQHRSNAEAEMSRMFEFTLEVEPHLSVLEANSLFPKFSEHYGHAGLVYARYLATHREQVSAMLRRMQKRVVKQFAMEQVDRHWAALFASVLVAMHICRGLKLWAFEVEPVEAWMAEKLAENRGQKEALVQSDEEKLGQMLRDLWPDVLITIGRGDRRGNPATIPLDIPKPQGALKGRMVQGGQTGPDQLWLSRPAVRKWAVDTGANYKELLQSAINMGWADPNDAHRFDLGVGTAHATNAYVLCWRMFPDRMPLAVPSNAGPNVVPMTHSLTGRAKP